MSEEKCDLSGAAFMFSLSSIWWYLSNSINISSLVCECMKSSSKYVMIFLLRMSGQKILLINAENAAGNSIERSIRFVFLISNNELC